MTTEEETLKVIAEILGEAGDPDIVSVATFGGGLDGPPGVRVEHADCAKSFLVISADTTPAPWR